MWINDGKNIGQVPEICKLYQILDLKIFIAISGNIFRPLSCGR